MGVPTGGREWGRLLTAMITPFAADGSVNYREAARIATYLVDEQKNDGIVVSGTTGESPTLSHDEKLGLLEAVLEAVGDRAAVLFGAGTYDTRETVAMTEAATKAGAHGIMLVSPYYSRPGQMGLYAHFATAAAATDLPILIYNIQPRTSINLETPTFMRLIENVPNIVAVKEASGNLIQIQDVCAQAPEGFRVYSGDDALTLPILAVGGCGVISVTAHVVGSEIKVLLEAAPDEALRIQQSLLPITKALFSAPNPVPVKYALSKSGFDCEAVRLPLVLLTDDEKRAVDAAIGAKMGY